MHPVDRYRAYRSVYDIHLISCHPQCVIQQQTYRFGNLVLNITDPKEGRSILFGIVTNPFAVQKYRSKDHACFDWTLYYYEEDAISYQVDLVHCTILGEPHTILLSVEDQLIDQIFHDLALM